MYNCVNAKILRWGNSYGIRISKKEAEREGLREGQEVVIEIKAKPGEKIDVSWLRPMDLGGLADHHDEVDWA
jgi:antitoxin component of MazEF toxin-antitoxin module